MKTKTQCRNRNLWCAVRDALFRHRGQIQYQIVKHGIGIRRHMVQQALFRGCQNAKTNMLYLNRAIKVFDRKDLTIVKRTMFNDHILKLTVKPDKPPPSFKIRCRTLFDNVTDATETIPPADFSSKKITKIPKKIMLNHKELDNITVVVNMTKSKKNTKSNKNRKLQRLTNFITTPSTSYKGTGIKNTTVKNVRNFLCEAHKSNESIQAAEKEVDDKASVSTYHLSAEGTKPSRLGSKQIKCEEIGENVIVIDDSIDFTIKRKFNDFIAEGEPPQKKFKADIINLENSLNNTLICDNSDCMIVENTSVIVIQDEETSCRDSGCPVTENIDSDLEIVDETTQDLSIKKFREDCREQGWKTICKIPHSSDCDNSVLNFNEQVKHCPTSTPLRMLPGHHMILPKLNILPTLASIPEATHESDSRNDTPLIIIDDSSMENIFGNNLYNAGTIKKSGLRMIVIDGSNVAHGHSNGRFFSVEGLQICIQYFISRGHKVVAFVPHFRVKFGQSSNPKLLDKLANQGLVVYTPSREVNGKKIVSYDDRFIIQCAALYEGIVVSCDNYKDLHRENPSWRSTIENRLLMPTWVADMIMFPPDPLGRRGPTLDEFLRFP